MAEHKLILPAMGEGVMEATIINWLYSEGDFVKEDDSVVEIATDKVDSDVPTPVSGKIIKILKQKDEIAKIGEAIAILEIEGNGSADDTQSEQPLKEVSTNNDSVKEKNIETIEESIPHVQGVLSSGTSHEGFLSPLVKNIISKENITNEELNSIKGTGQNNRITKEDILLYLKSRGEKIPQTIENAKHQLATETIMPNNLAAPAQPRAPQSGEEIIPMDRMRRIIAENMVKSKHTAPHVTSFIESDVTPVVRWRLKNKDIFEKRYGEKLTFMPIFVRAVVKAIQDYPMINISVEGENIIKKSNINIGMATALPDGNLIVPVIKNADQLSISGLAKAINDLAFRARNRKLKPEDTQGATYTISNVGSFGNLMGTPIIPLPQVAILAIGAIVKKPAVISTPEGDAIAIRHLMFMSHSYDHRVVDGSLGGMFLKHVHDYLENWDPETEI